MSEEIKTYTDTNWEDLLEYNGMTWINIDRFKSLQQKVEQLENIRKEAIEYIDEHIKYECDNAFNGMQFFSYHLYDFNKQTLLNILNKGE